MLDTNDVGAVVAHNIATELERKGWTYDRLGDDSGLGWHGVICYRSDAITATLSDLAAIADALGVAVTDLLAEPERKVDASGALWALREGVGMSVDDIAAVTLVEPQEWRDAEGGRSGVTASWVNERAAFVASWLALSPA